MGVTTSINVSMAQCNFSIQFDTTADEVAEKARQAIQGAGGTFRGDATSGNFDVATPLGLIRGTYVIRHPLIQIAITSKPFFITCNLIEKQLKDYFQTLAESRNS
jgi:hypothetical protein